MKKRLTEMSLEELWELFPIRLREYNPEYKDWYGEEKEKIEKVFHLHVRYPGDPDELYFRDYLRDYEKVAEKYEKLKRKLSEKYKHDRDGYTEAKSKFIEKFTKKAREEYEDRYGL
ncbi:MAG: GrpB family protein [Bacillota bacterium]